MDKYYMEILSQKHMGRYLSAFEAEFIKECLQLKGDRYKWQFAGYYPMSARAFVRRFEEGGFHLNRALGYKWTPAGQDSNFFLIPLLMKIERWLNLGRFIYQSPSVIYELHRG